MKVYTDGAASGNGTANCIAGWAFAIYDDDLNLQYDSCGRIEEGTNNIGELTAILNAVKYLNENFNRVPVTIYSDSAYCINGINEWRFNWQKFGWYRDAAHTKELKNRELWKELDTEINPLFMKFEKVKGHANDPCNNYVDKKAVSMTK